MNKIPFTIIAILLLPGCSLQTKKEAKLTPGPRIVNIINFIRQSEPRDQSFTEKVLYETVNQQVKLLSKYNLPGTFLLQYDALINPKYQSLLKNELNSGSEIGAWWEITQPHVEAAGMVWRGRYSWDWEAHVGFATGYTPIEREKLVDVYMEKFQSVFGYYPASVGSWFIDAHTLAYMYDKYHIIASCNCKDQYGTDGYTLWGGYWNQAYYPSRKNAYMPAQTEESQIPVPVFRMLGSDPIYQYDCGLGGNRQGVESLEPVYEHGGGSRQWVEWFFKCIFDEPCLAFNYTQAGQENSFSWNSMKKGLEMQIPILDSLSRANKIRIETLGESGKWFREKFRVTPATAVTALTDHRNEGRKTIWFNSRFYRVNLLWKDQSFRFRDIHLFDERLESDYLTKAGTSTQCIYSTLPVVDGFLWSTPDQLAGLRLMRETTLGNWEEVKLGNPIVTEVAANELQVECIGNFKEKYRMIFYEDRFEISCPEQESAISWMLELRTAPGKALPFQSMNDRQINATLNGFSYSIICKAGKVETPVKPASYIFRLIPANNKLIIDCSYRNN